MKINGRIYKQTNVFKMKRDNEILTPVTELGIETL